MPERIFRFGIWSLFGKARRILYLLHNLFRHFTVFLFIEQTAIKQVLPVLNQTVPFTMLLHFFFRPVSQIVIRGRMGGQPVHDRVDQRRTLTA